jgi:NitT/TauT family transport system ATP-binding protein
MTVETSAEELSGVTATPPAIELVNVSKEFRLESGEMVNSVNSVSFRIEPGEFVCLIGPSGHGKSTLLNMIAGFFPPTDGTITVGGTPVTKPGPDRGVVFQRDTLFLWKTVAQNIEFGLKSRGIPKAERKAVVAEMLRIIGLEKFADAWPKQLSGGMRRRVAIAAVFANKPEVLLMDEPFVGIDYLRLAQLHEVLLDLWKEAEKRAVFMITHDIDEALALADRIFVIKHGRLALDMNVHLSRPRLTDDITGPEANALRRQLLEEFSR